LASACSLIWRSSCWRCSDDRREYLDDRPLPTKAAVHRAVAKGDELHARDTESGSTTMLSGQFFAYDSERMDQYARLARGEPMECVAQVFAAKSIG